MKKWIAAGLSVLLAMGMVTGCAAECPVSFEAEVLEIRDDELLVRIPDGPHSPPCEEVIVQTDVKNLPELCMGDWVRVCYNGELTETSPARIRKVYSVEQLETKNSMN